MGSIYTVDKIGALSESGGSLFLSPSTLTIGGQQYRTTSTISIMLSSLTANRRYQVFAVINSGNVELVTSLNNNDVGPAGYTAWKLVGAFYTAYDASFNGIFGTGQQSIRCDLTGNQSIPSTASTEIVFDNVLGNAPVGLSLDPSTGYVHVAEAGMYRATGFGRVNNLGDGSQVAGLIHMGGVEKSQIWSNASLSNAEVSPTAFGEEYLEAGDTIYLRLYQDHGSNRDVDSSDVRTNLLVSKVDRLRLEDL